MVDMRLPLILSFLLHGLILGWAVFSISRATDPVKQETQILDVSLVTLAQSTDLTKGVESGKIDTPVSQAIEKKQQRKKIKDTTSSAPEIGKKIVPQEVVKPKKQVEVQVEKLSKPKEVPLYATKPGLKPKPSLRAVSQPGTEIASLKNNDSRKIEEIIAEKSKEKPSKDIDALIKEKQTATKAKQQPAFETKPKTVENQGFDASKISALLNKIRDTGENKQASLGVETGREQAVMSQSEIDLLRSKLADCWRPLIGAMEAANLQVLVKISLNADGSLRKNPQIMNQQNHTAFIPASESAKRAVYECAPFDFLSKETYNQWQEIQINFDPRAMFGKR